MDNIGANLIEILKKIGLHGNFASIIVFVVIVIVAILANWIAKHVIVAILRKIILKTRTEFDDVLIEKKVFDTLSHIVPALIIYFSIPFAFENKLEYESIIKGIEALCYMYMIVVILIVINSFLNAVNGMYKMLATKKNIKLDIKTYIQVVKIVIIIIGSILIISVMLDKKPGAVFLGLGALAAVILLIFKDTILGFVASIQLSAYKMLSPGDWITMPSRKADGDVIDISLNTVKVQNFDKTISTIPTYALVSESFTNWKGMKESGGRRIKRCINIDTASIKFCSDEMLDKFKNIHLLKDYITSKQEDIKNHNKKQKEDFNIEEAISVNVRQLTNIGTFRKYIELYLKNNLERVNIENIITKDGLKSEKEIIIKPGIFKERMTLLVRQLQASEKGLPIEIYVFASTTNWGEYETIQADLFDHLFAILPEFDLKVFQNPTGNDFQNINC